MGCMFAIKKDLKMGDFCTKTLEVKKKRTRKKTLDRFPRTKECDGWEGCVESGQRQVCVYVCVCVCVFVCVREREREKKL